MATQDLYSVAVTAIIEKEGKYLITKRSENKKHWPGRWTVPGGTLDEADYRDWSYDSENEWYNVLERVVRREVREEVGIEITDIDYVTSILVDHSAKGVAPTLIISLSASYAGGELTLDPLEVAEAKWVDLEEARQYDLIGDIYGELVMARKRGQGNREEWHPVVRET